MLKNNLVIYWASEDGLYNNSSSDWCLLSKPIVSLYSMLAENISVGNHETFFKCPSVKNLMKQTFVIKSSMDSSYEFIDNTITTKSRNGISVNIEHKESVKNNKLFVFFQPSYFFCEEDLEMTLTAPFFNKSPHLQYGAIVPGTINIGSWFRCINIEFNLWENINNFIVKENEPIAYIRFNTDKNIILKQFKMNEKLTRISRVCSTSSSWEKNVPLIKRYSRFKESKTNVFVLNEIKKQLLD